MNIILAHGILGFRQRFGIEYFNGVREHLAELPARVFVPEVSATEGIEARGEQLREAILKAFADGTLDADAPAHLIAHSMGGLDSRSMLSPGNQLTTPENDLAGRIVSLTTISTPHRGSPIADLLSLEPVEEFVDHHHLHVLLEGLLEGKDLAAHLLGHLGISLDGLKDLTTESAARFNRNTPDNPRVRCFSVAGRGRDDGSPTAVVLRPFHEYITRRTGLASDGLVSVESAQWAGFDANLWPADHADEIGHDLDHPLEAPHFDYLSRYDAIVRRAASA
jgi:triacylglycerol lipase